MSNKNPFIRNNNFQNIQPQPTQNSGNNIMSFIQEYGNNPQKAQQEVMQLINSGQLTQQMLSKASPQVAQIMQMLGVK